METMVSFLQTEHECNILWLFGSNSLTKHESNITYIRTTSIGLTYRSRVFKHRHASFTRLDMVQGGLIGLSVESQNLVEIDFNQTTN